jgi:hypothetical protein
VCLQLAVAKEVLSRLEATGDCRPLAVHEDGLRQPVIVWLRKGDAPTQFFHTLMPIAEGTASGHCNMTARFLSLKKPRQQLSLTSLMRS